MNIVGCYGSMHLKYFVALRIAPTFGTHKKMKRNPDNSNIFIGIIAIFIYCIQTQNIKKKNTDTFYIYTVECSCVRTHVTCKMSA